MTRKAVIIALMFMMVCSMLLNGATRETVPPAPAAEKSSAATAGKDDSENTAYFEQEGSESDNEPRLKVSWHVVAAAVAIVAAAVYFLVIKKSSTTAESTRIQINSNPEGATIFLDGRNTGRLTNDIFSHVTPGHHNVKLSKSGYEDYVTSVWVTSGQTIVINATLIKN